MYRIYEKVLWFFLPRVVDCVSGSVTFFFFLFLEYTELYVEKHSHFFTRLSSYIPKRKDEIDETLNSHIRTFGRLTSGKSTGPKSVQIHHPLHSQLRNQIRSTFLRGGLLDFKSTK